LQKNLNTSLGNINLTITTYMVSSLIQPMAIAYTYFKVFQAAAPTFVGGISDRFGRRPAYFICFTIYLIANTGLALQKKTTLRSSCSAESKTAAALVQFLFPMA
jgi:MFS family permease